MGAVQLILIRIEPLCITDPKGFKEHDLNSNRLNLSAIEASLREVQRQFDKNQREYTVAAGIR